jgi:hypothetical protein
VTALDLFIIVPYKFLDYLSPILVVLWCFFIRLWGKRSIFAVIVDIFLQLKDLYPD